MDLVRFAGVAAVLGGAATAVLADDVFVVTDADRVVAVDGDSLSGVIRSARLTGLAPSETILALDVRPADLELYGVTSLHRLARIDTYTGVCQPLSSSPFSPLPDAAVVGFDFDPVLDRARLVTESGQSLEVSPVTGAVIRETARITLGAPIGDGVLRDFSYYPNSPYVDDEGLTWVQPVRLDVEGFDPIFYVNAFWGSASGAVAAWPPLLPGSLALYGQPVRDVVSVDAPFTPLPDEGVFGPWPARFRMFLREEGGTGLSVADAFVDIAFSPVTHRGPIVLPDLLGIPVHAAAGPAEPIEMLGMTSKFRLVRFRTHPANAATPGPRFTGVEEGEEVLSALMPTAEEPFSSGTIVALGTSGTLYEIDPVTAEGHTLAGVPTFTLPAGDRFTLVADGGYVIVPEKDSGPIVYDAETGFVTGAPVPFYVDGDAGSGTAPRLVAAGVRDLPSHGGLWVLDAQRDAYCSLDLATGELRTLRVLPHDVGSDACLRFDGNLLPGEVDPRPAFTAWSDGAAWQFVRFREHFDALDPAKREELVREGRVTMPLGERLAGFDYATLFDIDRDLSVDTLSFRFGFKGSGDDAAKRAARPRPGRADSMKFVAHLPRVATVLAGHEVALEVGPLRMHAVLDAKGRGSDGSARFSMKKRRRDDDATLTVRISREDFDAQLADVGIDAAADAEFETRTFSVRVTVDGLVVFARDVLLDYSAKAGRRGRASISYLGP